MRKVNSRKLNGLAMQSSAPNSNTATRSTSSAGDNSAMIGINSVTKLRLSPRQISKQDLKSRIIRDGSSLRASVTTEFRFMTGDTSKFSSRKRIASSSRSSAQSPAANILCVLHSFIFTRLPAAKLSKTFGHYAFLGTTGIMNNFRLEHQSTHVRSIAYRSPVMPSTAILSFAQN
jgi:hypothetical protein